MVRQPLTGDRAHRNAGVLRRPSKGLPSPLECSQRSFLAERSARSLLLWNLVKSRDHLQPSLDLRLGEPLPVDHDTSALLHIGNRLKRVVVEQNEIGAF